MLDWFFEGKAKSAAKAALARESVHQRTTRLESREAFDAAAELGLSDGKASARATLHCRGIRLAIAAALDADVGAAIPESAPLLVLSAARLSESAPLEQLRHAHSELLGLIEAPARALEESTRAPWRRAVWSAVAVVVIVTQGPSVLKWATSPRNLARGKPWSTSSTAFPCRPAHHDCGGSRTDIFFHTNNESNPWLLIDLERVTDISGLTVVNRLDELLERAVPLVVEVSQDGAGFTEVVRQPSSFSTWEPRFQTTKARYVRLRVDRTSVLHLERVEVHP